MRTCISINRKALTEFGNIPDKIKDLNKLGVLIILDEDRKIKNPKAKEKGNLEP